MDTGGRPGSASSRSTSRLAPYQRHPTLPERLIGSHGTSAAPKRRCGQSHRPGRRAANPPKLSAARGHSASQIGDLCVLCARLTEIARRSRNPRQQITNLGNDLVGDDERSSIPSHYRDHLHGFAATERGREICRASGGSSLGFGVATWLWSLAGLSRDRVAGACLYAMARRGSVPTFRAARWCRSLLGVPGGSWRTEAVRLTIRGWSAAGHTGCC